MADVLVLYGLQHSTPITWSLLGGVIPLGTYILTVFFLREHFMLRKMNAIIFSIIGATLVLYIPGVGVDLNNGGVFFLTAVLVYSISSTLTQQVLTYLTTNQLTFLRLSSTAVLMCIIVFIVRPNFISIPWPYILINSFGLIIAISLSNYIIRSAGAAFFTIGSNIVPIFTVFLSIVFVREWPSMMQILGGTIILSSVLLFYSSNKILP